MMATKRITKGYIRSMLNHKHPGRKHEVEERRHYSTAEQRQEWIEKCREWRERINAIEFRHREMNWQLRELVNAGQFVVDVDAQAPSLSQFKAKLATATEHLNLLEEKKELHKEVHDNEWRRYAYRFRALHNAGWCYHVIAEADTLEELAEKIESKDA